MFKCKIKNKDLLYDLYINKKMSTTEIAKQSNNILGFSVSSSAIWTALRIYNIPLRSISESVSRAMSTLDIDRSFLNEELIEWIDGFLLGDGSIGYKKETFRGARFSFGSSEKQWTDYAMSKFKVYNPLPSKPLGKEREREPNIIWGNATKTHPDIVQQAKRWYPNGVKIIPEDVRMTPTSIMLWYLGDGYLFKSKRANICFVTLATCGFLKDMIENILIRKFNQLGLFCKINNEKKIVISGGCLWKFFEIIGRKSPISCYDYKFDIPDWILMKNLKTIMPDRKERWRAIYHIQRGHIPCQKSPGGHYFLFNKEQEKFLIDKMAGKV